MERGKLASLLMSMMPLLANEEECWESDSRTRLYKLCRRASLTGISEASGTFCLKLQGIS